jgi:hypothetical protein
MQPEINMDNYTVIQNVFTHNPVRDDGGEYPAGGPLNVWSTCRVPGMAAYLPPLSMNGASNA